MVGSSVRSDVVPEDRPLGRGFFVRWRAHPSVNRGRQPILFVCPRRGRGVRLHWSMPRSDEEQAWERFGIGWSSEEERAEANAYEDGEVEEIEGLLRTHERKPPRR